jgi:predicted site-specific integrase-resolvase
VFVKLSEYAARNGIQYRAAWNRYKAGKIEGAHLDDSGHVVVPDPRHALIGRAAVYARVSTHQQRDDLDRQAQRMTAFANAAGLMLLCLSSGVEPGSVEIGECVVAL